MSKIKEAEQKLAEAEKSITTSLFKWKKDWEVAGDLFDKAALAFKVGKDLNRAKEVYLRAADAHKQYRAFFHAAKSTENASTIAKDQKLMDDAVQLLAEAAALYMEHGASDQAAITYEKAAAMAEKAGDLRSAVDYYLESVNLRDMEDRPRMKKIPLTKAMKMAAKAQDYDKCLDLINKQLDLYIELDSGHTFALLLLSGVVIYLKNGDYVAADNFFTNGIQRMPSVATSESCSLANDLLTAWDENDAEKLRQCQTKQHITFLENEIARIAQGLALDDNPLGVSRKAAPATQAASSGRAALLGRTPTDQGSRANNGDAKAVSEDEPVVLKPPAHIEVPSVVAAAAADVAAVSSAATAEREVDDHATGGTDTQAPVPQNAPEPVSVSSPADDVATAQTENSVEQGVSAMTVGEEDEDSDDLC